MPHLLNALIIDDSQNDADLFCKALNQKGYDVLFMTVDTPETLLDALDRMEWDFITVNRAIPQLTAAMAFSLVKEMQPYVPFITLADEIDSHLTTAAQKNGSGSHALKRELARLVPAVQRILRDKEVCH